MRGVEERYGFGFPPDIRQVLQYRLPIQFVDWRHGPEDQLRYRLGSPLAGVQFDVEHNDFWWPDWGEKPKTLKERLQLASERVKKVPVLIPVYGHRFIASEPRESGNPVFSVVQTDIIYYGYDLADYFAREFKVPRPDWAATGPKRIDFWSDVEDWNATPKSRVPPVDDERS